MGRYISLIAFLVIVLGGGLAIGFLTPPDDWFAQLNKPAFNPPGWLFGPVWTALYILIAIVGWRWWQRDRGGVAMRLWYGQLALNFLWSPIFFVAHQIGAALAIILLLLVVIFAFIRATWQRDQLAGWLFVLYAAWVAFASILNASIFALN
jgi:translocator protein